MLLGAFGRERFWWPVTMGVTDSVAAMLTRRIFLLDAHNPFKDPCWRWHRTGYLLDHGRQPLPDLDDAVTGEAWLFRKALSRCRTDADREQLALEFPGLTEAHAVYTGDR